MSTPLLTCSCGKPIPRNAVDCAIRTGRSLRCVTSNGGCGRRLSIDDLKARIHASAATTNPKTLARASHPDTSAAAAAHVVKTGKLGRAQRAALDVLHSHPGSTASELAQHVSHDDSRYIGRRLSELERKGFACRSGKRRCGVTGRIVTEWT